MSTKKKIRYVTDAPPGLFYISQFITTSEEDAVMRELSVLPFEPYDHYGYKANREVVYFGTPGGYEVRTESKSVEPFPDWLNNLSERFAALLALRNEEISMALVARYGVGIGIGWHRDRPQFGPSVMGISFASGAEMRFRRFLDDREEMYKINLENRSAYIIGGASRSEWQHSMNPVKQLRYSITFRTIRDKQNDHRDFRHYPETIAQRLSKLPPSPGTQQEPSSAPCNQLKLNF